MLQDFNIRKEEIIQKLKALYEYSRDVQYENVCDRLKQELDKLEASEFNLMVVGQFKRGKSTLLNYLIGDEILPTGVIPITSIITEIKYGDRPGAYVVFTDGSVREVATDDLPEYVSEERNPENEKNVRIIRVHYPSQNLKNGLVLIDTPGIGSIFKHNTEVAYGHLPQADAVVFVISSDPPISELEIEFLREVKKFVDKVFIIQNKIDYLDDEQVKTTVEFSERVIKNKLEEQVEIYPVSALNALNGVKKDERERFEKSRMAAFEHDLNTFLISGKGEVLLSSAKNKFNRMLEDVLDYIGFRISNLEAPVEELEGKLADFENCRHELGIQERETVQLVDTYIKYIIDDVEKHIETVIKDNLKGIVDALEKLYDGNKGLKPRAMAQLLQETMECRIKEIYEAFNAKEKEHVRAEFEKLIGRFTERLNKSIEYINGVSRDVFGFQVSQPVENVELVNRDVFYFKFGPTSPTLLLPSKMDVAKLMPRSLGNKMIFNEVIATVEQQMENNGANLKWEYVCRLRDSKFIFERLFREKIYSLIDNTHSMVDRIIEERKKAEEDTSGAINRLMDIKREIERLSK
ncbi:MAG: Isoniazid inducible protein IniA, dynamin-like protein [Firmicutes bacterium]|nr:Isoniazid inducible protein IniA, dynamin-like protein [Bacillota bacterium]MDI6705747.1 dynamin family protein [Bacillota bacterium]